MSADAENKNLHTHFIQGSNNPAFRGSEKSDVKFLCSNCNNLLIENYDCDSYIEIGIKCFACGIITWTPSLEPGEILPHNPISSEKIAQFLLKSTVTVPHGAALSSFEEVLREHERTAPRLNGPSLALDFDGIGKVEGMYDRITKGKYQSQADSVIRGGRYSTEYPLVWALNFLKARISEGNPDFSDHLSITAIMTLMLFWEVVNVWGHHPRFDKVSADLGKSKSFIHTACLFIAAATYYQRGVRIGFSLEDKHAEPNPDLYIKKSGRHKRLFLEVKAPEKLQAGEKYDIYAEDMAKAIKSAIKGSSRQINKSHPGILIIASTLAEENTSKILEREISEAIKKKGRDHKSLEAIVALSPTILVKKTGETTVKPSIQFHFTQIQNPHFDPDR